MCTSILVVAGNTANLYCNLVTTPGSLLCTANTLYCYKSGCGFLNPEAFPLSLLRGLAPTQNSNYAG
jgi:hypothetical protein